MKNNFKIVLLFLATTWYSQAQKLVQKIGENPTIINSSAALEIESTSKGLLPPRMTQAQMNAISSPANGLLVFCTNCSPSGLRIFNGSSWNNFSQIKKITYQANSSTYPSSPSPGDDLFVTVDGTSATAIKEQWQYDGVNWKLVKGSYPVSGVVIDNTINNPANFTSVGRYIMPLGSIGSAAGKDNQYADFDGITVTYTPATNEDRISISLGPNANTIWYYNGTSWALQSEDALVSSVRKIFTTQAELTTWINSTSVANEGFYIVGFASPAGLPGIAQGCVVRKVTKSGVQTTSVMFNYLVAPTVLQNDADGLPRIKTGLGIWQIPLTSAASARTMLVTKSSSQFIPWGYGGTTITNWNAPTINEFGNMFNSSTGVFTNTSSKTIRIRANATVLLNWYQNSSAEGGMELRKNNAGFVGSFEYFFAPYGSVFWKIGPKFSPVFTLAPNETFSVTVYQVGGNLNTHTTGTQLAIEEVF